MVAGEAEDRQVERRVKTPDVLPVGLRQEFGFRQFAGGPAIQRRLVSARKHFEAEHQGSIGFVEAPDRRQLPLMVLRAVVFLTEQDDPVRSCPGDRVCDWLQRGRCDPSAGWGTPGPCGGAGGQEEGRQEAKEELLF